MAGTRTQWYCLIPAEKKTHRSMVLVYLCRWQIIGELFQRSFFWIVWNVRQFRWKVDFLVYFTISIQFIRQMFFQIILPCHAVTVVLNVFIETQYFYNLWCHEYLWNFNQYEVSSSIDEISWCESVLYHQYLRTFLKYQ